MIFLTDFSLPFKEPVLVFSVVLLVILFTPLIFNKVKIPGVAGLIISGVILGPQGFHVLERDNSIILFGTVGLLYIMFMAGLEIDMNDFKKNKNKSLVFGALTFFIPLILGWIGSRYILGYTPLASLLLASMFSTHTLISYPIVSRLGIAQNKVVTIIIGGTIITDAAVLMLLAVITNLQKGNVHLGFWFQLVLSLALLIFLVLWGVPKIGSWFFRNLETEGNSQYLFVLLVVFLSGFLAKLAGVEPIIGAFLAGLALNQLIPPASPLMNRIEFGGNTFFIPFFLISVGMLVDVRVLLNGPKALLIAGLIILISFTGKWIAAFFTQKIYRYSSTERSLIWGMSSAHAAATIAVVVIGYNIGLLDENVLNGTVLLILVSCIASTILSEKAGRKIAIAHEEEFGNAIDSSQRILVPVANPENISRLMDFALLIKNPRSSEPLYPLFVMNEGSDGEDKMKLYHKKMGEVIKSSITDHVKTEIVFRVDLNVANGITRAVKEIRITELVMGWNGRLSTRERFFGSIIDRVVNNSTVQIMFCKFSSPLNVFKNIVVVVPGNAEHEDGFSGWVNTMSQFTKQAGANLKVYSTVYTLKALKKYLQENKITIGISYEVFEDWEKLSVLSEEVSKNDLLVLVLSRPHTVSYHDNMTKVPRYLSRYFEEQSFVIVYPGQV